MKGKILLVGKDGKYFFAEKNYEDKKLKPTEESVPATEVIPYGFDFGFGKLGSNRSFGIVGYTHHTNLGLSKEAVARKNLDLTVSGLEKTVEEKGADFVLVDNMYSEDMSTYWQISGRAQILIKRS